MRLISLTALTMLAFAANSILTRMAIEGGHIDPSSFAAIRIVAGAIALAMILTVRGGGLPLFERARIVGALSLAAYMIGFSLAYATLDAGLGALILFGVVQVTIFIWGALRGATPSTRQLSGASLAFVGLLIALWPSEGSTSSVAGTALMVIAGLGWAAYTLVGRGATNPLAATAANFVLAMPLLMILLVGQSLNANIIGIGLAILCGAVTSGLGYSLWYAVLPKMTATTAAIVQLSVPIIAIAAGAVFLGEVVSLLIVIAAALVVGGIALAVTTRSVPTDHT
ncbi:MAG: drug/metabolite transporter (DMT)-like permease [Ascidiaceihabitans sp.]|jgi:drug/metabolite transporter (DMT)-like permease